MKRPPPPDDAIESQSDGPMRTIGNLKLPEEHVERFKAALERYETESIGFFLRRCAYMMIRHAEAGDILEAPWRLRTVKLEPVPEAPPAKDKRGKKSRKAK
jgi:hypothetical protein